MNTWIHGSAIVMIVLMCILSLGFLESVEKIYNFIPIFGLAVFLFFVISLFLPAALLLNSLRKEWKRADVWLHSTGSAFQLFGAKATIAAIAGAVILVTPTLLFLIYVGIFGSPIVELTSTKITTFIMLLISSLYLASIMMMIVGLSLGVFHQLIKPVMKGFAVPITIVFFFIMGWVYERMKESSLYQKVVSFGPIGDSSKGELYIERNGFFIGPTEPVIYTGDVLFSLLFIVILFVTSVVLFEKKVRL